MRLLPYRMVRLSRALRFGGSLILPLLIHQLGLAVEPIFAPALRPGDTVMIIAPAGPLNRADDPADMERAQKILEQRGFKVRLGEDLFRRTGFLAGPDDIRVGELNAAIRDPEVRCIFPGRGGYGMTRIVDRIDFDALRKDPKIILGFSDITVLHNAVMKKTGLVTFQSPNAVWGLGIEGGLKPPAHHFFWRAISADSYNGETGYSINPLSWSDDFDAARLKSECKLDPPTTMVGGTAQGRLVGGNLSLIAALMGTPYEPKTKGNILYIEDVGEAPYSVDRMLSTMKLAGKLDEVAGVLIGDFHWKGDADLEEGDTTTPQVLESYFKNLGVPVITNFTSGHIECNLTLPIGALVEIDAGTQTLRLLENPVAVPKPVQN